ncbi:hypothetical protein EPR50_G00056750, partial [Perca flavescens]
FCQQITIFDSESEDQTAPDAAILTTSLKGTKASPAEQLSMALAWDREDIAQKDVLVYGQHWQVGSLEQAMLDALVMDRVSFVKLLIDNGMTMSRFLTVERLEELYNTPQGQTDCFLHQLVEDAKQTSLPIGYRFSLIDMGQVIEYLIGGAYRSTYTRKPFRAAHSRLHDKEDRRDSSISFSKRRHGLIPVSSRSRSLQDLHFFRTAQPYKLKDQDVSPGSSRDTTVSSGLGAVPLLVPFNFNDLFVWAVLHQRQQMALFLWQHGEEALARATVACKLYRSMAFEARQSSMDDNISDRFRTYSLEFGQLAVDVLDRAFRQNEQMAMKLLTSEMEAWSRFTCLQMAVSSSHRPFVSHSCTQTLLTDLWTGSLNMRKNSFLKIILSLLLPPAILLLEFKSKAEMCHVPQSHEAMLFGLESVKSPPVLDGANHVGRQDAERGHDECFGPVSETVSSFSVRYLSWITRLYEFYTAPVVKFWFHTMSYLAFLMLFSYVVLVKMGDRPSVEEWVVIAYILSTAVEKTREVLMSEPRKLSQKLKIWFSEYWNISDFVAILLFLAGLALRWHEDPYRTAGRISYCLDIIFWFVRVTDLLAVNQHAGPYLTMITRMTSNMFFIVVMMAIVLLSFGVSRKAILSPDEEPSWSLARDVVFQPYWMIYGEVYAGEIDPCEDGNPCPPYSFLTAFLQAVYLFFQYIIMVNILIAFFNNIYFDMASTSNKLWKYNRYRYIMTYQDRPWLPPPLILLSHMTLAMGAAYRKLSGDAEREERASGLKLNLGLEDRKKLHEFEEKCVQAYINEKSEGVHSSQINRIRNTAERAEEMVMMMGEVSEKVLFIQDSLSELDCQLGQLQDLSVLAVDTLTLLSASDSLHQAHLAQCRPITAKHRCVTASHRVLPHSWTLHRSGADCDAFGTRRAVAKACKSTPPSLLKCCTAAMSRRASQDFGARGSKGGRQGHAEGGEEEAKEVSPLEHPGETCPAVSRPAFLSHLHVSRDQTPVESCAPSRCGSPLSPRGLESPHYKHWTWDPYLFPSREETSMEEEEEEDEEEQREEERTREHLSDEEEEEEEEREEERTSEHLSDGHFSRASSSAGLLSNSRDVAVVSEGLVNPAFSQDDGRMISRSRPSSQWGRPEPRWARVSRDRPYGYCRSLSSSVENVAFSGAPLSPTRGSFSSFNFSFGDDTSLGCSKSREWSKSSDFSQAVDGRGKNHRRKTVKIQESCPDTGQEEVEKTTAVKIWRESIAKRRREKEKRWRKSITKRREKEKRWRESITKRRREKEKRWRKSITKRREKEKRWRESITKRRREKEKRWRKSITKRREKEKRWRESITKRRREKEKRWRESIAKRRREKEKRWRESITKRRREKEKRWRESIAKRRREKEKKWRESITKMRREKARDQRTCRAQTEKGKAEFLGHHQPSPFELVHTSRLSDGCRRRRRRLRGESTCWSASTSLSQLNFEPMDLLQKQVFSHQDVWSPTHSAWNSWARPTSRRSSLQSGITPEAKSSSFQSTDNLYPHYSAMERNNLMRLAHTIPFTPVSFLGGEEVSIYSMEEVLSESSAVSAVSAWSSRGLSAMLQPLASEEGSLDGGLRRGCRVLCTWAERDVLRPGLVYMVKAFRPEVVRAWQRYFHGSTALQLCLREIQQQRAAQKMMKVFNEVKPDDMHHSPRFLDVALVLWLSNGQWLTIERNMCGDFRKYNNNNGEEIAPCCSLEETLLAFSHWTYEHSARELLVLDIQGVGEELTDPTVITADDQRGEMLFGPDNLGDAAISGFLQNHSCSSCCRRLGLTDLRTRWDSSEGTEEQDE